MRTPPGNSPHVCNMSWHMTFTNDFPSHSKYISQKSSDVILPNISFASGARSTAVHVALISFFQFLLVFRSVAVSYNAKTIILPFSVQRHLMVAPGAVSENTPEVGVTYVVIR